MRVGFTLLGGRTGTGSYNYIINLIRVLLEFSGGKVRPVFFVGSDVSDRDIEPFEKLDELEIIRHKIFNDSEKNRRLIKAIFLGVDNIAQDQFLKHDIDVVFESAAFFGWRFRIPAIAWIPDFQHKRLRYLFSFSSYWKRELGFRLQILSDRVIMLSSESAQRDCIRYYPTASGKTEVVRFSVDTRRRGPLNELAQVRARYGLPEKYFYLPNQFWKHKNHEVVIQALKILKDSGYNACIAASGNPYDPRFPGLYDHLRALVSNSGLEQQFIFLGLIPYGDLLALMAGSIAVINPSLFEGWSTTVEEARSLGVPLILSNIDVHREQMTGEDTTQFFPASSAEKLAEILKLLGSTEIPRRNSSSSADFELKNKLRLEQFCDRFAGAANQAIEKFRKHV
jgi:glycosyltransferase involved in cell wall biosynthesis